MLHFSQPSPLYPYQIGISIEKRKRLKNSPLSPHCECTNQRMIRPTNLGTTATPLCSSASLKCAQPVSLAPNLRLSYSLDFFPSSPSLFFLFFYLNFFASEFPFFKRSRGLSFPSLALVSLPTPVTPYYREIVSPFF